MKHRKPTWVKYSTIKQVTVWETSNDLRKARRNGLVEFRRLNGIDYKLDSINPIFLKKVS